MTDGSTQPAPVPPAGETVDGPTTVTVDLDALAAGAHPSVPFAQNGVMFLADGAGAADFQSLNWYSALAWGEKAVVTELQDDGRAPRLHLYDTTSQQAQDVLVEQGADSTVVSADHRWLAYVDAGEGGAPGTITVADARTGESATVTEFDNGSSAELLAVVDGTVYYTFGGLPLRSASSTERDRHYPYDAAMVSDDGSLVATVTKRTDFGSCHGLVQLESEERLWDTCDWAPTSVSPDGRWVYARPGYLDGYGDARVAVLDAETGELVREVRAVANEHWGLIRDAEWESSDSLLLNVESGGNTALVRLDVITGEAELATDPLPHGRPVEGASPPPYLLG